MITQNIPKNTWNYHVQDNRKRLSSRRTAVFLPLGAGASAKEGAPITASQWDAALESQMGVDAVNKSMVEGFAQNTDKAQITIFPFTMEEAVSATGNITLSYTTPANSRLGAGSLVFAVNEARYVITVNENDTIDNLADALTATLLSDGQVHAVKKSVENGITVEMTTVSEGETANLTSVEWLVNDAAYTLPNNLNITEALFTGGKESTNLSDKIALYKTELRYGGYTQFMSPYTESKDITQIHQGFEKVWDDQIINDLPFTPLLHIVVINADTILDAQEYAEDNRYLSLSIIPEKGFKGDLAKRTGRINGDIFMSYQQHRMINSMHLDCTNLTTTNYWTEQEADILLSKGLSPLGKSSKGEPMILRLISSYKESSDSKPINTLTSVLGAVWVIKGIVEFNENILNQKYVLVNKKAGGNKITAAAVSVDLYNYIANNFASGDDRVIDEFKTDQVSVIKTTEDKLDCNIRFTVPDGLTFINTTFLQILGG